VLRVGLKFPSLALAFGLAFPATVYGAAGDHIRFGDTVVVPALDLGFAYRTNPTRAENNESGGGLSLTAVPQLGISVDAPEVIVRFDGDWRARKYLTPQLLTALDRYADFSAGASVSAFHRRAVGFKVSDTANMKSSANETVNAAAGEDNAFGRAYNTRFRNRLGGDLVVRAGPTLAFDLGGAWSFDDVGAPNYSGSGSTLVSINRRHKYGPTFNTAWTFFPRSALVLESEYNVLRWQNNLLDSSGSLEGTTGNTIAVPNSTQFRVQSGLRGRLTERVVVVVMGGYGQAKYDGESAGGEGDVGDVNAGAKGLDGLLASLQLKYELGEQQNLAIGYQKGFTDSFFTNYISYNAVNLALESEFGRRLGSQLAFVLRPEGYHGEIERTDLVMRGSFDLHVNLAPWVKLKPGVGWQHRNSTSASNNYDDISVQLLTFWTY
jgi:hypothetical protein